MFFLMNINEQSELKFLNWSTNVKCKWENKIEQNKTNSKWERPQDYKTVEKTI